MLQRCSFDEKKRTRVERRVYEEPGVICFLCLHLVVAKIHPKRKRYTNRCDEYTQ